MKSKNLIIILFFVFLSLSFPVYSVLAATVALSPSSGSYRVGDNISVRILVNTSTSVNAISSKISFPNNLLSLSSISKSGSIISLWAQEPTFNNGTGTANLEGVVLSGYTGNGGNIATLNFKASGEGQAEIKFLSSSVLANDGNGTEVGTGSSSSFVTIAKAIEKPKESVKEKPKSVEKPTVVETVVEDAKQAVEKVRVVEEENKLPNYSLVITLLIIFIMLLILIILGGIYYMRKLWIIFKKKVLKSNRDVLENLEVLKRDLDDEIVIANKIRKNETLDSEDISFQIKLEKDINNAEGKITKEIKELEVDNN